MNIIYKIGMFSFVFKVIFAGFFLFSAYELLSSQKNERVTLFLENYKSYAEFHKNTVIPQMVKTFRLKEMGLSKVADCVSVMPDLSCLQKCKCCCTKMVAYVLLGCSFLVIFRIWMLSCLAHLVLAMYLFVLTVVNHNVFIQKSADETHRAQTQAMLNMMLIGLCWMFACSQEENKKKENKKEVHRVQPNASHKSKAKRH